MQADKALRFLVDHSPLTGEQVGLTLGKSRAYISVATQPGRVPRLDTFAAVADVAGVDVVMRDRATGEVLGTIEPPRAAVRGERP